MTVPELVRKTRGAFPGPGLEPDPEIRAQLALLGAVPIRYGGASAAPPFIYLLRDQFTTDRAAGSVNGTAAEPGPGTRTVTDTENKISVSGGKLVSAGAYTVAVAGQPAIGSAAAIAFVAGRTVIARQRLTGSTGQTVGYLGWGTLPYNTPSLAWIGALNPTFRTSIGGAITVLPDAVALNTDYDLAVVRTGGRVHCLIRGGALTNWTLVNTAPVTNTAALYAVWAINNLVGTADDLRVVDLPAPFNTDYGLATARLLNPAGNTLATHTANLILEFTITFNGTGSNVYYRRNAAGTSYWRVAVLGNGDLHLREVLDGVDTARGSSAAAFVSGNTYRVVVIASGSIHTVYVGTTQKITYTDPAGTLNTETGLQVGSFTTNVLSELIAWPRTVPLPEGV